VSYEHRQSKQKRQLPTLLKDWPLKGILKASHSRNLRITLLPVYKIGRDQMKEVRVSYLSFSPLGLLKVLVNSRKKTFSSCRFQCEP
jgi:hypothetical protein